jgi:hypothetical protein
MNRPRSIERTAERSQYVLFFVAIVLHAIGGRADWPGWAMPAAGCAGSVLFIVIWLLQARSWREKITRYVGDPGTGKAPSGVRTWQRAVRLEAAGRYGPDVAGLTVRSVRRMRLGKTLYCVSGLVVFGGFVAAAWGGSTDGYVLAGVVLILGMILGLLGVADCRAAGTRARALGVDQGAMRGVLMARETYLLWCGQHEQEPYPFNGQDKPRVA